MKTVAILSIVAAAVSASLLMSACSSAPKTPREQFEKHWKETGSDVQVMEVLKQPGGYYHGSGIVDKHPVDEFYNPATGQFIDRMPVQGDIVKDDEPASKYTGIMNSLAKSLAASFKDSGGFAVVDFTDRKGKPSEAGLDLAERFRNGLVNAGRDVVERAKLSQAEEEHSLQQAQGALFDNTTLARLGKWTGAVVVVSGTYSVVGDQLQVTARALSVETAKVVTVKDATIPLSGPGSDTFFTEKVNHSNGN